MATRYSEAWLQLEGEEDDLEHELEYGLNKGSQDTPAEDEGKTYTRKIVSYERP